MNRYQKVLLLVLSLLLFWLSSVGSTVALADAQCAGDVNFDGTVNLFDLVAVAQAYNASAPVAASPCDVNDDGYVNLLDLVLVTRDFGQCPGSECIKAEDAARYVGQNVCVEFYVAYTHREGQSVFLDSHYPYQNHFYVYIYGDTTACGWPALPETYFDHKWVGVWGTVTEHYEGWPQIVLAHCGDIEVIQ